LYKEKFNFNDFVLDIIKNFEISNKKRDRNIKFKYNGFKNLVTIEADRNRLNQVITNLISNSIKFIDKDVEEDIISISVGLKKDNCNNNNNNNEIVVFDIRDNGTGIDKEILPKLFTKFTSKSFQGTGLGLYISKNIVEAHGGRIWAKNNDDGKGATFSFSIPLYN
jgi:signal transduction histidine kinase